MVCCDLTGLGTMSEIPDAMQTAHALPTSGACAAYVVLVATAVFELLKYVDTLRLILNFSDPQMKQKCTFGVPK